MGTLRCQTLTPSQGLGVPLVAIMMNTAFRCIVYELRDRIQGAGKKSGTEKRRLVPGGRWTV